LAQIDLLRLLDLYEILIPAEVRNEVVDKGKIKGYSDALLIEKKIEECSIKEIKIEIDDKFEAAAQIAGLHKAEITVIYYAFKKEIIALLDDDAARIFARGLGIKVKGTLGVLIDGFNNKLISHQETLSGLNKLSQMLYFSADLYQLVLKQLEKSSKPGF
jgi:predicted nucleic acid-binding protein